MCDMSIFEVHCLFVCLFLSSLSILSSHFDSLFSFRFSFLFRFSLLIRFSFLISNNTHRSKIDSLQILLLEKLHHAIAVLVRRQIPQRDPHAARHHAVHHRQRRLMHALAREALMLPDLLNHHLFRQPQRRVRRAGIAVPSSAQLARSQIKKQRGFDAAQPLFRPPRTTPASRLGPLRCTQNETPTHVDRDDGPLQPRGILVVSVDAKERRSVGMAKRAQF